MSDGKKKKRRKANTIINIAEVNIESIITKPKLAETSEEKEADFPTLGDAEGLSEALSDTLSLILGRGASRGFVIKQHNPMCPNALTLVEMDRVVRLKLPDEDTVVLIKALLGDEGELIARYEKHKAGGGGFADPRTAGEAREYFNDRTPDPVKEENKTAQK